MTNAIQPAFPGGTPTTAQSAVQTASDSRTGNALTSDFDAFLKMLTAQARYQDPLEPIDSTEYAAQLAQFSMVEQQVQSNQALANLSAQLGVANMASLSGWVGMEARAAAPVAFDGAPVTLSTAPHPLADSAFLVAYDSAGNEVQRNAISLTSEVVEWAGVGDDGTPMPAGAYVLMVESHAEGGVIGNEQAQIYGRIVEAQTRQGQTVLILEGGQAIAATAVSALRSAAPDT